MSQFSNQRLSEYLAFNSPGLTLLTSATVPGWGSGCGIGGTYNCYGMTMSNLGDVGVQIVRIYINSTGSGCSSPNPQPCILNPTLGIASLRVQSSKPVRQPRRNESHGGLRVANRRYPAKPEPCLSRELDRHCYSYGERVLISMAVSGFAFGSKSISIFPGKYENRIHGIGNRIV